MAAPPASRGWGGYVPPNSRAFYGSRELGASSRRAGASCHAQVASSQIVDAAWWAAGEHEAVSLDAVDAARCALDDAPETSRNEYGPVRGRGSNATPKGSGAGGMMPHLSTQNDRPTRHVRGWGGLPLSLPRVDPCSSHQSARRLGGQPDHHPDPPLLPISAFTDGSMGTVSLDATSPSMTFVRLVSASISGATPVGCHHFR